MDRRGESEESGDDETRRRSINGDVDPNQPTTTSKTSLHMERVTNQAASCDIISTSIIKV